MLVFVHGIWPAAFIRVDILLSCLSQVTQISEYITVHFNRKAIFHQLFPFGRTPDTDVVPMYLRSLFVPARPSVAFCDRIWHWWLLLFVQLYPSTGKLRDDVFHVRRYLLKFRVIERLPLASVDKRRSQFVGRNGVDAAFFYINLRTRIDSQIVEDLWITGGYRGMEDTDSPIEYFYV